MMDVKNMRPNMSKTLSTTSWPQNDPFPPWQFDGEPQLKDGQYFCRPSSRVEIYKSNNTKNES